MAVGNFCTLHIVPGASENRSENLCRDVYLRPALVHDRTCAKASKARVPTKPLQTDTFAVEQFAPQIRSATYTSPTMLPVAMTL